MSLTLKAFYPLFKFLTTSSLVSSTNPPTISANLAPSITLYEWSVY
jgi:hypothetical protein